MISDEKIKEILSRNSKEWIKDVLEDIVILRVDDFIEELQSELKKLHVTDVINSKNDIEERAKHFINFFGDYALTVIQKTRNGGNYFNEELFEKVEEMLQR